MKQSGVTFPSMSPRAIATAVAASLLLVAGVLGAEFNSRMEPLTKRLGPMPVVVELFTSQGCSSCPPADALIASIAGDESLRGRVIPLAYHVDYWDRLGWKDPFSSRAGTLRQMIYVRTLRVNSAYTPQAVVSGKRQLVGNNPATLDAAIVEASHARPFGSLSLDATRQGDTVVATVKAVAPEMDVMLALVEYGVTTEVKAGENEGRTILNDAVVRSLSRVGPGRTTLKVDPAWKQLGVVAFIQERDSMAIVNAAAVRLP
jgi:hypothetical protein